MKTKLNLNELRVKSFVTDFQKADTKAIKGGASRTCSNNSCGDICHVF